MAELTSTYILEATPCHFAIAFTWRVGVGGEEWGGGHGVKDPNVPKFRKPCKNFHQLARFGKNVPLLLTRYFISQSSEERN